MFYVPVINKHYTIVKIELNFQNVILWNLNALIRKRNGGNKLFNILNTSLQIFKTSPKFLEPNR